jgi:hypothetical protein
MGAHCRSLNVVLRVTSLDDGPRSGDHEATWLVGHTENITFLSDLWEDDQDLYVEAAIHVPCRFLSDAGGEAPRCEAWGFTGSSRRTLRPERAPRRLGPDRFRVVEGGRFESRVLPPMPRPPRELPVHAGTNPCVDAPCRTADHTRGAACCRDLQIEIMCTNRERKLESLIRSRKSPYLCKIDRESPFSISAEVISACGFLLDDGIHCALHGRQRSDGRPAKPELCSEWPDGAEVMHPGCVFRKAPG